MPYICEVTTVIDSTRETLISLSMSHPIFPNDAAANVRTSPVSTVWRSAAAVA